jgi:hypothetical protein
MKRRVLAAIVGALTVLVCTAAVAAASGWHVVKSRSASGQFTTAAISASILNPHQVGVRFEGGSGLAVWACARTGSVSSYSHNYKAGTYSLPHIGGSNCQVTVSIAGSGHVTVQILTR